MKSLLRLTAIAVLGLFSCTTKHLKVSNDSSIKIGKNDSIFSKTLNEVRKLYIYVPEDKTDSTEKYPVVYLLDAATHFHYVAGLIRQLALNDLCPKMIVVGIPNTDRTRDMTPTHVAQISGDSAWAEKTGGGENFTKFIGDELIPYIDSHYPATSYRTLIGHSFGGMFCLEVLRNHPALFNNYLSIDPSLWWDDQKLLGELLTWIDQQQFNNKFLFVAVANTLPFGKTLDNIQQDTTQSSTHIRSVLKFVEHAKTKTGNGLTLDTKYYPQDDHGSVNMISEHDALRSMFSWYKLNGLNEFLDSSKTADELLKKITSHYEQVSRHFEYTVLPPENMVNAWGYAFLRLKAPEKALVLFNL
ncbi:MAG: esterase, partial [Marivirga sp.]|nr:esterase [Marivirga sp.]